MKQDNSDVRWSTDREHERPIAATPQFWTNREFARWAASVARPVMRFERDREAENVGEASMFSFKSAAALTAALGVFAALTSSVAHADDTYARHVRQVNYLSALVRAGFTITNPDNMTGTGYFACGLRQTESVDATAKRIVQEFPNQISYSSAVIVVQAADANLCG